MNDRLSNLFLVLLLLLPLLAVNSGWHEINGIFERWEAQDQERFASQKLGEVAANMDFSQQLAEHALRFRQGMASLLLEYPKRKPAALPFRELAENVFSRPFPSYEIWSFVQESGKSAAEVAFCSEKSVSRRPMEMVFSALVSENLEQKQSQDEVRRNEKLLQKIFGFGCTVPLLAGDQRGIATPVIYRKIPSYLLWDFSQNPDGRLSGFFIVISRNQDLDAATMRLAARKTGLGSEAAGGFVRLFDVGSPDQMYPERLENSEIFRSWRDKLGTARENLEEWEIKGFPWAMQLGNSRLYTRILLQERHLAVLLLPAAPHSSRPIWLQLVNLMTLAALLMIILRGMILGVWPFASINSRFAVVFILAATLPVALFITSATAYCFERFKADESHLEETLATSLSDFDAGKESLENVYMSAFSTIKQDTEILQTLEKNGIGGSEAVFGKIRKIADDRSEKISISGMALFDLGGNLSIDCRGNIRKADFETLARFYGLPFTLNLRRTVSLDEPGIELPFHKIDQNNLAAIQSFKRGNEGIEYELERYRNRVVRTDFGRGYLGYIYDFITINGKNRYVLMVAWLESDIDQAVIQRSADQLGLKAPQIRLAAFKKTPNGEESLLRLDRSFSPGQLKACRRVSDSAFSIKSGVLKTSAAGMSVVAYASKHFDRTVLIGAIDHALKDRDHKNRILIFVLLGFLAGLMLIASALAVWFRIVKPLKEIKGAFDLVEGGRLIKLAASGRVDEIGMLNDEFNNMIRGLEERHRLASMLSEHAVAAVSSASSDVKAVTQKFSGVVMVSDIRSFTTMCEQQSVEQVTALLNTHITEMANVINRYGGKIYKFIGDAIEAVFVDDYHFSQTPGLRAVTAGTAMLQKLQEINEGRQNQGLFSYRIGIGLAAGELIAGETGSRFSRRDYAMFGSAFKRAEEFEALTKHFVDWPLVADRHVVEATEKAPFEWKDFNHDGEYIFNLEKPGRELQQTITADYRRASREEASDRSVPTIKTAQTTDDRADNASTFPLRLLVFVAGLFCILFPLAAFIFAAHTGGTVRQSQAEKNASAFCDNIIARLKVTDSQLVMLEQYLDDLSEEITAQPWHRDGMTAPQLEQAAETMSFKLKSIGLQPSLFAVLHKPSGPNVSVIDDTWKLVHYEGEESSRSLVTELLQGLALKQLRKSTPEHETIMRRAGKLLGINIEFKHFFNDAYARVVEIKRDGKDGYLFWQPLIMRNPEFLARARSGFSSTLLRKIPQAEDTLDVGVVIFQINKDDAHRCHLNTIKQVLNNEKIRFAFAGKGVPAYVSNGFPLRIEQIDAQSWPADTGWLIREAKIPFGDREFRFLIAAETLTENRTTAWAALILAFFLLVFWHRSVFREVLLARSFASQLWLGLFAAAVVPITCVYTVNEWYAIEQKDLRIREERVRMISLFEQLERRQFMQETAEWDKMHAIAESEELRQFTDSQEKPSIEELKRIETIVRTKSDVRHKHTGRTSFTEMILFSNKGWQHSVYPDGLKHDASEFNRFINAFLTQMFTDLGVYSDSGSSDLKPDGEAVKNEMTREAGLQIFRTMFGADAYFKLVHGLNLPLKLFYSTGNGCLKLIPRPGLCGLNTIYFWLFFDSLNSTMRQIFKKADTEYPVFSEAKSMYGALKQPWTGGCDPEVNRFARWSLAAKAPLSTRSMFAGRNCLVEARIGSHNETMLMVGMASEDEILAAIEGSRERFLYLLIFSLVAIALLTWLVSSDISVPVWQLINGVKSMAGQRFEYRIQTSRADELGQMMQSFNSMARGLQERELMGQMVSRAARRVAGDEESLRLAEAGQHLPVTVMYLSVNGFSKLQESLPAEELLAKISRQIDVLCGIIINNDGEADKIIGEKILAYFYSPAGLVASNAMALRTLRLIAEADKDGLLPFPATAGIHAGDVIAGLLGISSKRDFTIIGDTVNTAARINARAAELEKDRYLVSETVVAEAGDIARFEPFGSVQLKGKAESVNLLRVRF